jgi:hypothetical protein
MCIGSFYFVHCMFHAIQEWFLFSFMCPMWIFQNNIFHVDIQFSFYFFASSDVYMYELNYSRMPLTPGQVPKHSCQCFGIGQIREQAPYRSPRTNSSFVSGGRYASEHPSPQRLSCAYYEL